MPRVSILIAHEGDAAALESTLVSVLEHRPDDCEILVAHDGAYTDPYDLSDEVRFVTLPAGTRVDQSLAAATLQAGGDVLHLLGAGAEVEDDWAEAALECFDDEAVGMVCPIQLAEGNNKRVLAAGVRMTWGGARKVVAPRVSTIAKGKRISVAGPSRHAAFYRREDVMAVGGWPTTVGPDLADVDIAHALMRSGVTCAITPESVVSFATPPAATTCGAFRRGYFAERLYWRHTADRGVGKTLPAHLMHCLMATFAANPLSWLPSSTGRSWGLVRAMLSKDPEPQVHPQFATPSAGTYRHEEESIEQGYAKAA